MNQGQVAPHDPEAEPSAEADVPVEQRTQIAERQQAMIERSLRGVRDESPTTTMPSQLTARARRHIEEAQRLVLDLRKIADQPLLTQPIDPLVEIDPVVLLYRETVAMTESALRLVLAFPDTPSVQLRLCEGVEGILTTARERLTCINQAIAQRNNDAERIDILAAMLTAVHRGERVQFASFLELAELLLSEAGMVPIRILHADPHSTTSYVGSNAVEAPARFVAARALSCAQVVAYLVRQDVEWRQHPLEPILIALLQDIGMLGLPVELLATAGPLSTDQRRLVEAHPRLSAECILQHLPEAGPIADAIAVHHERLNGTGYPLGLKDTQISPAARLVAIADVYASMRAPRPHRAALDPRTALTDTLMMAEQGMLDRNAAEKLLGLSFYPVGTVVELADGSVALVVANHRIKADLSAPLKPVVAILTTPQRVLLPAPFHIDLSDIEGFSVVRTLPAEHRRTILGKRYPAWV